MIDLKKLKKEEIILFTSQYFENTLSNEATGHDWFHIERVWKLAKKIAEGEKSYDLFIVEMGALLHDIADHKFYDGDEKIGGIKAQEFLQQFDLEENTIQKIVNIVQEISYKGAEVETPMSSIEGKIVQDADRLDAIGAIGVARAFAYGGSKKRQMYHPNIKPVCHTSFDAYKNSTAPTINHFYEKLLLLKDRLNTDTAKEMAIRRHTFMEQFLTEFYLDWDAK
jgi:uncharacterized protein